MIIFLYCTTDPSHGEKGPWYDIIEVWYTKSKERPSSQKRRITRSAIILRSSINYVRIIVMGATDAPHGWRLAATLPTQYILTRRARTWCRSGCALLSGPEKRGDEAAINTQKSHLWWTPTIVETWGSLSSLNGVVYSQEWLLLGAHCIYKQTRPERTV